MDSAGQLGDRPAMASIGSAPLSRAPAFATRPRELEDWLNRRLYHPLSRRLAAMLALSPVTPNMVSVAGGLLVVAAASAYVFGGWPAGVLAGFAMHLGWHVVDGADGDLARMTGRGTANGELFDGVCDYASHIVLYLLLATLLDDRIGGWAWAAAAGAGGSRIAQSNHSESQRRTYLFWAYGIGWLRQTRAARRGVFGGTGRVARFFARIGGLYVAVSTAMNRGTRAVDAIASSADTAGRARLARLARAGGRRTLPFQTALNGNPRTVLLGLSMIAGSPLWFFLIEMTLLNVLLVVSIRRQNAVSLRIAAACSRLAAR